MTRTTAASPPALSSQPQEGGVILALWSESLAIAQAAFIDNSAPTASVLSLQGLRGAASISDTTFTGNAADDDVTTFTNSPINWSCRLGSWIQTQGAYLGDLSTPACYPCSAGFYGNTSGLTKASCSGTCFSGHFCEEGTIDPEPCPPGRYSPVEGAPRKDFCLPCAPGESQPLAGQTGCLTCPAGSFSADVGLAACEACPRGGYCEEAGAATRLVWEACKAGTYNPEEGSSSSSACLACPMGTYSPRPGAVSNATCEPCRAGTFAGDVGLDASELCESAATTALRKVHSESSFCAKSHTGGFSVYVALTYFGTTPAGCKAWPRRAPTRLRRVHGLRGCATSSWRQARNGGGP